MIRHSFGPALLASVLASPVWAFGEVGRWSSGWGQGTAEYVVVDARQNQLYIACNDTEPATMTLTVGGRNYTREQGDFVLFIDGKGPYYASDAGSRSGATISGWRGMPCGPAGPYRPGPVTARW